MKINVKLAAAAAVLTLSLGAGFAYAAMSADDAIKARKACMKQGNGGIMGVAVPVMKGEKPFDAAALKAAIDNSNKLCADWANWWGEDTKAGSAEKTNALPAVWAEPDAFKKGAADYVAAAGKLAAVTDEAGFKAAFPALGGTCKGCHDKFRAPTQ